VTDGERLAINETGNPGMATGGMGDVLTGLIAGLLCQGLGAFEAARLGVFIHGLAGDIAARRVGQLSLVPEDVLECVPSAFVAYEQVAREGGGAGADPEAVRARAMG